MNSKIVLGIVVGLIAGLLLGVFVGVLVISPSGILPIKTVNPTPTPSPIPTSSPVSGVGTNNQVQVSGTIQEENASEISFSSIIGSSQKVQTSAIITNGQYSVVLVGNQSYDVVVAYPSVYEPSENNYNSYTIFVPSGVTTFSANF
jgi:hypothetical protein